MHPAADGWPRIAVIGGGQMGRALIGGWLLQGASPHSIAVADPQAEQRAWLATSFPGIALHADNAAAAAGAAVWLLAVKPQQLGHVARSLAPLAAVARPLVLSIAAGIGTADIGRWLGAAVHVVRAMPNRPALVGAGASALYADQRVSAAARKQAARLLEAVGSVVWVESEDDLHAATALAGSGPAYFLLLIELLEAAAIAEGLAPAVARRLALDTAAGAGILAQRSGDDPATLRRQVASAGGTTAAALAVFEAAGLRDIVGRAVRAASLRSREIAAEYGRDT